MYQNNQYGANAPTNINTSLFRGYGEESALELSGWNNKISIKMRPFVGMNTSGMRTYETDKSKIINTALSLDNCYTIATAIHEILLPAIKEGKAETISTYINDTGNTNANKKIISIAFDGENVKLTICCNVSVDNVAMQGSVLSYTFKNRKYFKGYDMATGSIAEEINIPSEAGVFFGIIDHYYSLIPMDYHADKYSKATEYRPQPQQAPQYGGMQQQQNYNPPAPTTQGGTFSEMDLPF